MTDRLLTDEEISAAFATPLKLREKFPTTRRMLRLQDAKTDPLVRADERRKMAEWLDGPCEDETHEGYQAAHWCCHKCMIDVFGHLSEGRAPWAFRSAPEAVPGDDPPSGAPNAFASIKGERLMTHYVGDDCPGGHHNDATVHTCYYCDHEGTDVNRVHSVGNERVLPVYCCDDGDACEVRIKETAAKESKHRAFLHDTGGGRKA